MAAGEALIAPSWNSANFYYELQQALNSGELQFIARRFEQMWALRLSRIGLLVKRLSCCSNF